MCGNVFSNPIHNAEKEVSNFIADPWSTIGTIGGAIIGGPLGAAAGNFAGDVASQGPSKAFGRNLGSNLEGAVLSGVADYGIGQLTAAGGQAFPEISAAINNAIPNFGISDTINSVEQSLGFGGAATDAGASGVSTSSGALSPSGAPANTPSAGASGGGAAGGALAPGSVTEGFGPDATTLSQGFGPNAAPSDLSSINTGTPIGNVGSQLGSGNTSSATPSSGSPSTSTTNVGTGTTGTQGLSLGQPDTFSGFASGPGGANLAGASDNFGGSFTPAPTKDPNSFSKFANSPSLANAGNILTSNPGAAISAAGLGLDAIRGNKQSGAEKNLEAQAGQLNSQGQQLENYLQTGTLPAGEQAGVNQALQSAIASIKSKYASMGMSGSSAEQQDIANAQSQAQSQAAQMQEQLLSTGISETGMSSQLYQELMKNAQANDSNLSSAISNFSSAAASGGGISAQQLLKLTGAGGAV